MRNFHVPLPEGLHKGLKTQASLKGRPATEIAREAIKSFLEAERRKARDEAIAAFAQEYGGTQWDLDSDLEESGLELLEGDHE